MWFGGGLGCFGVVLSVSMDHSSVIVIRSAYFGAQKA